MFRVQMTAIRRPEHQQPPAAPAPGRSRAPDSEPGRLRHLPGPRTPATGPIVTSHSH